MKKLVKLVSVVLAVIMMVTAFAACSKNGGDDAKSEAKVKVVDIKLTDEQYAFGVDKNQPELLKQVNEFIAEIKADGTLDKICDKYFAGGEPTAVVSAAEDSSKDQLVVATNAAFEPFEYTTDGKNFYGIDMEIAKLLADKLGKELVIKNMDFDAVCLTVGQHKCDIAIAGLTVNEEREEYVTFTDSYYNASQKVITTADDTTFDECKTADDVAAILNQLQKTDKIGGQTGTTGLLYVKGDEAFEFAGLPAQAVGYKSGSLAVQDLINGNLKYVIIDAAPAECIVNAINETA